jgi:hypothetical protein
MGGWDATRVIPILEKKKRHDGGGTCILSHGSLYTLVDTNQTRKNKRPNQTPAFKNLVYVSLPYFIYWDYAGFVNTLHCRNSQTKAELGCNKLSAPHVPSVTICAFWFITYMVHKTISTVHHRPDNRYSKEIYLHFLLCTLHKDNLQR